MKELKLEEGDIRKILKNDSGPKRLARSFRRALRSGVYIAAVFLVCFYGLNFSAFWKRFQFSINKPVATATPIPVPVEPIIIPELPDLAPLLEIPKLGLSAPLLLSVAPDNIITELKNGVAHYQDTAFPGEIGNAVIVGHSSDFAWSTGQYKNVFALLDKLVAGDQIVVSYKKQKLVYTVTGQKTVKPNDVSVLAKSSTPQLTLLTCYPVGTTRSRLIISAELTAGTTTGTQVVQPNISQSLPGAR